MGRLMTPRLVMEHLRRPPSNDHRVPVRLESSPDQALSCHSVYHHRRFISCLIRFKIGGDRLTRWKILWILERSPCEELLIRLCAATMRLAAPSEALAEGALPMHRRLRYRRHALRRLRFRPHQPQKHRCTRMQRSLNNNRATVTVKTYATLSVSMVVWTWQSCTGSPQNFHEVNTPITNISMHLL